MPDAKKYCVEEAESNQLSERIFDHIVNHQIIFLKNWQMKCTEIGVICNLLSSKSI